MFHPTDPQVTFYNLRGLELVLNSLFGQKKSPKRFYQGWKELNEATEDYPWGGQVERVDE